MAEKTTAAKKTIIWKPQPKQELALSCPADEVFFGGAAGGGKTDYLLADFLDGVGHGHGHRGVLFRRSYPELEEVIIRSKELFYPLGATYKEYKNIWTFPSGSTLKFRQLERDKDVHKYQGHAYTWIGFDELPNWATDYCYIYMRSRLRSAEGLPCRFRATGNPGSVGHTWVKLRFIDLKDANIIYLDKETELTQCFIPSRLEDNQILMQNDPKYEKRLLSLPKHLQKALRWGEWDVFAGQIFEEFTRDTHTIDPIPLDPDWIRVCSMDWGYSKPFSIGWWAITPAGRAIRYREWYGCVDGEMNTGLKLGVTEVAKRAWALSVVEGCHTMVADPACWSKIDAENPTVAEKFKDVGWDMVKGLNSRFLGLVQVHDMLKQLGEDGRPMMLIFKSCHAFIRTIPGLVAAENRPEDVDTNGEDHCYDETRYMMMSEYVKNPAKFQDLNKVFAQKEGRELEDYDPLRYNLD